MPATAVSPNSTDESEPPARVGGSVTPPVLLNKVNPAYPLDARKQKIEGTVVVEAIISKDGSVGEAKVLRSADGCLDVAALDAVRQWRYSPAMREGKPVRVFMVVTVSFRLPGREESRP